MGIKEIAGLLGGLFTLLAFGTYIWSILKGPTKPKRATWWIWTMNSVLLLTSYRAEGAQETVWLAVAYTLGCITVALFTIKRGAGGWSQLDRFCFGSAIIAAALWVIIGPLATFITTLVIDLCGVMPTIYGSYHDPEDEDKLSWVLWFVGGLVSLMAVESLFTPTVWSLNTLTLVAYPAQITITAGIIVWFLVRTPKNQLT